MFIFCLVSIKLNIEMGNTCQGKYRSSEYAAMDEDGTPYYRPRTFSSQMTASTRADGQSDPFALEAMPSANSKSRSQTLNTLRLNSSR